MKNEEEKERQKGQQDNDSSTISDNTQSDMSLSTHAYKLFSQGKAPIEVAIELDLNEKEITKYYKEYWKLKGLYKLNLIHEEIKDDVTYFAKLYRVSKAAGMSAEHVVNLLSIANNDLPALENRYKRLQENVDHLESKELDLSINLEELKSQIQDASQRLGFYRLSCQKEVSRMLQLHYQNMRLNSLLRKFKNNNEEYLKIRCAAKQAVRSALSDGRQLLKFALLSLIESLHADPTKLKFLIHNMQLPLEVFNQNRYTEALTEVIVNEASVLYKKMVKDFANQTITDAANSSITKSLPPTIYSDEQNKRLWLIRHITQTSVYDQ